MIVVNQFFHNYIYNPRDISIYRIVTFSYGDDFTNDLYVNIQCEYAHHGGC